MKRSELREHIFRILFGIEFHPPQDRAEQSLLYLEQTEDAQEKDKKYIKDKAMAVSDCAKEMDDIINSYASGWKTSRMNKVELTILRLAVYEMKRDEDVPQSVAIDEAVELAKKYSGGDAPSFINGVLAKIAE